MSPETVPAQPQGQQIGNEAIKLMCAELGEKTLLLHQANVDKALLQQRIAELQERYEPPAPAAGGKKD